MSFKGKMIYKKVNEQWLPTAIAFLRAGDTFKVEDIDYLATSDAYQAEGKKEWSIKFVKG